MDKDHNKKKKGKAEGGSTMPYKGKIGAWKRAHR